MKRVPGLLATLAMATTVALLVAACGGAESTATPIRATAVPPTPVPPTPVPPTATSRPSQVGTPTAGSASPVTPVATAAPATPTRPAGVATAATTRPTPTPTPVSGLPTPVTLEGKRGGTLVTRSQKQPLVWDTFDAQDWSAVDTMSPMMNNLVFVDPYGDGKTIVGDAAEKWEIGQGGQVLTFFLRKGIKFHDGTPLTSRDVAYNINRGWKPRPATSNFFGARFAAIQKIETPDDLTVRITLEKPSNVFFQALSLIMFQLYPASFPFPEKLDEWKAKPIGTGPFRLKTFTRGEKMEYTRSNEYWKPGLPYLDGNVIINIESNDVALAAWRTGRIDASNLDTSTIERHVQILARDFGFVYTKITNGLYGPLFNQKAPWTDPRVREAVDLAIDRQQIVSIWNFDFGTPYAAPLLPPELGGQWGFSTEVMKQRPGYRLDKSADVARAKQLLAQAGLDPATVTIDIIGRAGDSFVMAEVADQGLRGLGFKTKLEPISSNAVLKTRETRGEFDIEIPGIGSISLDDPLDFVSNWHLTNGPWNFGKWSDPAVDALFLQQDGVLDVAKRKQVLVDLQEKVLAWRIFLPAGWRRSFVGHMPYVKNFPMTLPFQFQQKFRHEQLWLDRPK